MRAPVQWGSLLNLPVSEMKVYQSYILSILVSVALHAVLVFGLLAIQENDERRLIVEPQYISATLVESVAVKKPEAKVSKKSTDEAKRRARQRQLEAKRLKAQAAALKKADEESKAKRALEEQLERERQAEEAEAERQRLARIRQEQLETELANALAEEQRLLASEADERRANSYRQLIQQRLSDSWSRPPSARRGMETMIRLQLVPTGRVVGVTILNSSGDAAFDRSVELAAAKADLAELQSMPSALFEKKFRQVDVLFSPLDLRL